MFTEPNKDSKYTIKVTFYRLVDAFRRSDKDFYFKMLHDLSSRYGGDFYGNWSFFKITNSDYLKWISEKSCTVSDYLPFQHFCIIGGNEIIDVLAQKEPEVTIVLSEKVV